MNTFVINSQEVKFEVVEDKIFTNSLSISKVFGKQHKDIMRTIRDFPDEFNRRNFTPSFYLDKLKREQPLYNLTRDGFSMLVMGFTGKKAFEWKVEFIEAFNKMEEIISNDPLFVLANTMNAFIASQTKHNELTIELLRGMSKQNDVMVDLLKQKSIRYNPKNKAYHGDIETLDATQLDEIRNLITHKSNTFAMQGEKSAGEYQREIFTSLNKQMKTTSYYHIPKKHFEDAKEYIDSISLDEEEKPPIVVEELKEYTYTMPII